MGREEIGNKQVAEVSNLLFVLSRIDVSSFVHPRQSISTLAQQARELGGLVGMNIFPIWQSWVGESMVGDRERISTCRIG